MSEIGEIFGAMREAGRERRRSNLERSTALLQERGVRFESNNGGIHLIVRGGGLVVDYWPSTGLFIVRGSGRKGRGGFNLLEKVGA